jgi:hypothetical protein
VDARSILGLQRLRPSFLDDVSAAQARRSTGGCRHTGGDARGNARRRTNNVSHQMSRRYELEHPVDDPDEDDEDDDSDEDEDGDEEDGDEEETETWQVSVLRPSAKGRSLLDFRD